MKTLRYRSACRLLVLWTLVGCGQSSLPAKKVAAQAELAIQNTTASSTNQNLQSGSLAGPTSEVQSHATEIRVLFIGNSHSAPIPDLLNRIFKRQKPEVRTQFRAARSFGFLADHANHPATLKQIQTGKWDFVVLQAQKYSTSGKYTYPTDGAIKLSKVATDSGAKVLMYPEWSRQGFPDEYQRIKAIHDSIAKKTGARVAPIGEAWKAAMVANAKARLHAADGNHATQAGSYLNACVFFAMITNESPVQTEDSKSTSFPKSYRALEQAAWSTVKADSLTKK